MRLDDFILECWKVDSAGWKIRTLSDGWWEIKAESEALGMFRAVSDGPVTGVEDTLGELMQSIIKKKEQINAGNN